MTGTAERRDAALKAALTDADALYVTTPVNVRYLTGFRGSNGQLLLGQDPIFFTDGRYTEQSATEVPDVPRVISAAADRFTVLADAVRASGIARLAFEAGHLTVEAHERLAAALPDVELVSRSGVVESLRARKDDDEIEAIERAQHLAEDALTSCLAAWAGGTEVELAIAIETHMRAGGAGVAFETIVAAGPHSALPHARPRTVPVPRDGVLLIDMGARVDGYCSDMTRTFLRDAPDPLPEIHRIVCTALEAACEAVRPGASGADVDAAARSVIADAGWGEQFLHSTGHGLGLELHEEAGRLAAHATAPLEPGMVITVEPGIYVAGLGGVRVEDLLVVTESGYRNLTSLPRGPEFPA